jgi:hypothetical protein
MTRIACTDVPVFDEVVAGAVRPLDGASPEIWQTFAVAIRNPGEGPEESAVIRVELTGSAIASIGAAVEEWITARVELRGRSLPNNGRKIRTLLAAQPHRFGSFEVLD